MKIETHACLIWDKIHKPHYWWYTDEGGGHMIYPEFANPANGDVQHWCLGIDHVPTHRGYPTAKWTMPKTPWVYQGRHRA